MGIGVPAGHIDFATPMTPSRTQEGHYRPSDALAHDLIALADESALAPQRTPEDEHNEQTVPLEELVRITGDVIGATLDRTLALEASIAAAHGEASKFIANAEGRFSNRIATRLATALNINIYDAPSFLEKLYHELQYILQNGRIPYAWGEVRSTAKGVELITERAALRPPRTSPKATFYKDTTEL